MWRGEGGIESANMESDGHHCRNAYLVDREAKAGAENLGLGNTLPVKHTSDTCNRCRLRAETPFMYIQYELTNSTSKRFYSDSWTALLFKPGAKAVGELLLLSHSHSHLPFTRLLLYSEAPYCNLHA